MSKKVKELFIEINDDRSNKIVLLKDREIGRVTEKLEVLNNKGTVIGRAKDFDDGIMQVVREYNIKH